MNRKILKFAVAASLFFATASHALVGVGFQWGFDGSLDMSDNLNQQIDLGDVNINVGQIFQNSLGVNSNNLPLDEYLQTLHDLMETNDFNYPVDSLFKLISENQEINTKLPFYVSNSNWNRSVINLGGKVWIDLKRLKIINALEASFNFGVWEYETKIKYPTGINQDLDQTDIDNFLNTGNYENLFTMEEQEIGLDALGFNKYTIFGVTKTPLMKFNLDLTVKKNLVAKPEASKRFKVYLGLGPSINISTPVLSADFISNDVIKSTIEEAGNQVSTGDLLSFDVESLKKDLLEKLVKGKEPSFGGHIVLGTSLKLPVVPIALFADGKYVLYFTDLDDYVDIKAPGYRRFTFNIGAAINF